ncbi:MAG: NAD(P)H-dependent oxidoreductase subunit E [Lentisphaerae bacterium]|jgi:NADH-quinone oxidoreductase subunit E|nr:NAD(P)H-dependent oxidoreductase subunit E [Lentisphaerota bacterium]MBT5612246.1 NAD(P)H-dependent oxidoreductase subunit E [Lentisphaerota bacterium]MBT7060776.1 NAD(P)H-dependent oxidoreductase subunit E [Lentisphaerota bacterium]MBT7845225.1 NAD(P)H-dependent oxidoreductase subunit E [Lentisphaerota bacterium]
MTIAEIVKERGCGRENLIQILHDIQDATPDNSLHEDDLDELASLMNIPVADVVSTASFYTLFSLTPRGRHIIRLCESPPCYIMGEENILAAIREELGVGVGETTEDGTFTLETTSCLGACGVAPVMMIDDVVYGNLTEEKVTAILRGLAAQQEVA